MMTISFSCDECGKHYEVSPSLAGKRGQCKQCGHRMLIPKPALVTASGGGADDRDPYGLDEAKASPSRPVRRPALVPVADDDPYGLDDEPEPLAPLPPAMRRPAAFTPEASSAPAKPKKKKGGFFGSKSKASSGGGGGAAVGRVSIGGVIAIALFVLRIVAAQAGLFGLSSQSEIESYAQRDLAAANEMTTVLASIRDEPTAHAAVPRLSSILDRMIADGHALEGKKGRMTDIDAVKQKYEAQQEAAWQSAGHEIQRVGMVPGGADAIRSLQGKFQELAAIIRQANQADGNTQFRPTF